MRLPFPVTLIMFQRGYSSWGFQIGRLYLYWPYWSYIKAGCWPKFGWEPKL